MKRIQEIEGLRAIAVVAVLIFHFEKQLLPNGYLGVDMFFAVSGYVITRNIASSIQSGQFSMVDFLIRRIKRLMPALMVVLIFSSIASAMLMAVKAPLVTALAAAFGASNIWLWYSGSDYFAPGVESNAMTHTWSLGVEEQFYLFFPLMLLLTRAKTKQTLIVVAGALVISLSLYAVFSKTDPIAAFYLTPFRMWELLAGSVVGFSHHYATEGGSIGNRSIIKTFLILGIAATLLEGKLSEGHATALCILLTCAMLYLSNSTRGTNLLLNNRVSAILGKLSYSLYLWHWPVIVFAHVLLGSKAFWLAFFYITLTVCLSIVSYYFVEQPLRLRKWRNARRPLFRFFSLYIPAIFAFGAAIWLLRPSLYLGPAEVQESQFLKGNRCHIPNQDGLETCLARSDQSAKTLWLIGDSHAGNLLVSLRLATKELGMGLQQLTGRSLFLSLVDQCTKALCPEGSHIDLGRRLLLVARDGDVVVVSFARDRLAPESPTLPIFKKNLLDFVETLRDKHLEVVFVQDIPKVCSDEKEYYRSAFQAGACTVSAAESRAGRSALASAYQGVMDTFPATLLDPHDELCEYSEGKTLQCSNRLNGQFIYLDSSPHLTFASSSKLASFFTNGLQNILSVRPQKVLR